MRGRFVFNQSFLCCDDFHYHIKETVKQNKPLIYNGLCVLLISSLALNVWMENSQSALQQENKNKKQETLKQDTSS